LAERITERPRLVVLFVALIILLFLAVPYVFKKQRETPYPPPGTPKLSQMDYAEIFFDNKDLRLSALVFLPEGEGPHPVAVYIHGSGPSRRSNEWDLPVVKHLQENGIAVILPDKRGSEKSEGDWTTATLSDLAEDAISAIEYVKNQDQFDYSYIGVFGTSQGGWIVSEVAARSEDVSFVVSASGSTTTTDQQVLYQYTVSIADKGTYRFIAAIFARFKVDGWKKGDGKYIAGFDPISFWEEVDVPVFFALGENDPLVPVEKSIKLLEKLDKDFLITVYPNGRHGLFEPDSFKISDVFLSDLSEFINSVGE